MRLLDLQCTECGFVYQDVWDDEAESKRCSCKGKLAKVLLGAPVIDARNPFRVLSLGGPSFTSHREMEKYAKSTGQTVLTKEEQERRPSPLTMAERLKKNMPEKLEAFNKAKYRLRHGYQDHPAMPTEKELLKS